MKPYKYSARTRLGEPHEFAEGNASKGEILAYDEAP